MKKALILIIFGVTLLIPSSQASGLLSSPAAKSSSNKTQWHNPQNSPFNPIEGQYKQGEERECFYNRFPDSVKPLVREPLWDLSKHTAGLTINFTTDSPNITVRYTTTSKTYAMPHMPSTGVSGLDLYAKDAEGESIWVAGRYNFADTVTYNYHGISYRNDGGYEYRLFLPAYNGVKWLEIGVNGDAEFSFTEPRKELPIVAYGTSITQGACASRPGMIWSSIVSRMMDMPLYNFGFSGNGRLEDALIDIIGDVQASVYIIDCMPNLMQMKSEELTALIVKQVKKLRLRHPETPIILTDHLGYPHSAAFKGFKDQQDNSIKSQKSAFDMLKKDGVKKLYHLDYATLNLPVDATVEAIHPSDYGMQVYAEAYQKMLNKVLRK